MADDIVDGPFEVHAHWLGESFNLGMARVELNKGPNNDYRHCRQIATLLHQLAWRYEEHADLKEGSSDIPPGVVHGANTAGLFKPRKMVTRLGDTFWEVDPGKFIDAASWMEAFGKFSTAPEFAQSYDTLRTLHPDARVEEA